MAAENVAWTTMVGVQAAPTSNSLTKTSTVYNWDAGAVSTKALASGDGYVEFKATERNTDRLCGLNNGSSNESYGEIDYAIDLTGDGGINVYESGVYQGTFGVSAVGDRLRVSVENGVIRYSKNAVVFYTNSSPSISYPLLVDTSFYQPNSTITNAVISGPLTP